MTKRADHVVWNFRDNVFECRHCGDTDPMALPVSIDVLCAASGAFLKLHKHCKPALQGRTGEQT